MLRVGIVGCGGIAERRHGPVLASLNDRVKIGALADLAQERTELMGGKLGVASEHLYSDWEKMFAQEELDLVHICTPHHLHEPQAIAAMEAGRIASQRCTVPCMSMDEPKDSLKWKV